MNTRTSAHPASQALASVRAQNPQLADKLQLATGPAAQLALFSAQPEPPREAAARGLKDHDWDRQRPISKTAFSVVMFCRRCRAQIRLDRGAAAQYAVATKPAAGPAIVRWSSRRPVCTAKGADHG